MCAAIGSQHQQVPRVPTVPTKTRLESRMKKFKTLALTLQAGAGCASDGAAAAHQP